MTCCCAAGWTLLHAAAYYGLTAAAQLLLRVAPHLALVAASHDNSLPLHWAASRRHAEVAEMLIAAAPAGGMHPANNGMLPLHAAAKGGDERMVRLLLATVPAAALVGTADGALPLFLGAAYGHEAVVQELLRAAPAAALSAAENGWLPLHAAAARGHPRVVQLLLQAAPEAASAIAEQGGSPLQLALQVLHVSPRFHQAARRLVAAGQATAALQSLAAAGAPAMPLLAECLRAHLPLTDAQWALVPVPCPGLGHALPVALSCSPEQAAQLVRRLPAAEAQRLRTCARCLARAQQQMGTPLPPAITGRLMSMFDS